ncbi:MAG: sigma-70 family RNA polymerase sigma factor, partial [Clostridia bacterium]|nr:sigma-70 family RNA polymerase sigma factor [Clostridia bacterium]
IMSPLGQKIYNQGIEQGIEQGEIKGIMLTKKVIKLNLEGKTVAEIAKECEISEEKVKDILS